MTLTSLLVISSSIKFSEVIGSRVKLLSESIKCSGSTLQLHALTNQSSAKFLQSFQNIVASGQQDA